MSQEKIDKRKQNRGDMLHNTKKHMKMTTLIVALVLVAAGVHSQALYHIIRDIQRARKTAKSICSIIRLFSETRQQQAERLQVRHHQKTQQQPPMRLLQQPKQNQHSRI